MRILDFVNPEGHSIYLGDTSPVPVPVPVPVPAKAWLFGSGLLGLIAFAQRRGGLK